MKVPSIGELRNVAVFKRPVETEHASGQMLVSSATTLATMRAKYDGYRGDEQVQADQVQGRTIGKLWSRNLPGLTTKDTVTVDSVDFEIIRIENWENRDRWMICTIVTIDKVN